MAVRALVALAALATTAWFAVGVHQAQDTARASAIVSSGTPPSAAQATTASELLKSAAFLNPDRSIDVLRAQLDLERGDVSAAERILRRVIKAEPKNLDAWLLMERASARDVRRSLEIALIIRLLAPPVPATH